MNESQDRELEERLRKALRSPAKADFEGWRNRHGDAVAYLNPVVTELHQRRRKIVVRMISATVAAVLIVAVVSSLLITEQASFAEAVNVINKAETITWTRTILSRNHSMDGERTWITSDRKTFAYRAPGLYRDTHFDKDGNVRVVEIVDKNSNRTLHLNMQSKVATWKVYPSLQIAGHPLSGITEALQSKPLELVGQRKVAGNTANVFRYHLSGDGSSFDVWIDTDSKQLVGYSSPGADVFDPRSMADRDNPAEEKSSKGTLLGSIIDNITLDAQLNAELFSLKPPEGFEIVHEPPYPTVTEAELIEWLGVTARFNNGVFGDTDRGVGHEKHNQAGRKDKADRTDVEQEFLDLWGKHMKNRNSYPIWDFANEYAVRRSFRYLGKGVKLGSGERIVCWYKLKSTGTYRAVYGDLTVKDIAPEDLPLPVEE